jgi:hypothetical protein
LLRNAATYTWDQGDQMIWKKLPNIFLKVAKTVAKPNNAKIQTMFFKQLI